MSKSQEQYLLSKSIYNLAEKYQNHASFDYPADVAKIQVESMVAKLSLLYEKLRYAVDYKEEHLLRRNALERILTRLMLYPPPEGSKQVTIGVIIIRELIRAGYLPNDTIPESVARNVEKILNRYLILKKLLPNSTDKKTRKELEKWIIQLSSVEIEAMLDPMSPEKTLLQNFYKYVKKNLVIERLNAPQRERDIQIFITCHRALLKSDNPMISFDLLQMYAPGWQKTDEHGLRELANTLEEIKYVIDQHLRSPLSQQLSISIHKPAVYFSILGDTLRQHARTCKSLLFDVDKFHKEIALICNDRYKKAKKKLKRSAINSIIYIFLTKIILAFVIEVPYDLIVLGEIAILPLISNIAFHPFLMLIIAFSTRVPNEKNTEVIIDGITRAVYGLKQETIVHQYKKSGSDSPSYIAVNAMYTILYAITYGLILVVLSKLGFNLASGFLFIFFLSLIAFFGIRIRHNARELLVIDRKENIISFLFNLFTLPLLRVGRWISVNSSRVNIFVFLFDYIIENPFKLVVQGIEAGVLYVRQKKEEIYQ